MDLNGIFLTLKGDDAQLGGRKREVFWFFYHELTNIEYVSLDVDFAKGVGTFRAEFDGSFTADVTVMPRTLPFTCKTSN